MTNRHLLSWPARCRAAAARLAVVAVAACLVAGCDKCGNRLKPNLPTLPAACGDNADPSR